MCVTVKLTLLLSLVTSRFIHCKIHKDSKGDDTLSGKGAKECENSLTFEVLTNDIDRSFSSDLDTQKVSIAYGKSLLFVCYGVDAKKLEIKKDGDILPIKIITETVIKWSKRKPEVQNSEYVCTDTVTACKISVFVKVTPVFEEVSPNIQLSSSISDKSFTIQYGDSILISCVGSASSRLAMTKDGKELQAEIVGNAIRWFESKPDLQISDYVCTDNSTAVNSTLHIKVEPRLYIQSGKSTDQPTLLKYGIYKYEDSIEISCSGPRAVKLIRLNDNKVILTESVNKSTVKSIIRNTQIGESIYACFDSEMSEYISTVHLEVRPRMEIKSPNTRRIGQEYVTKLGDPVEIICSGPDATKLTIFNQNFVADVLHIVNETTVKSIIKLIINDYFRYCCHTNEAGINVVSEMFVRVDNFAKAADFHCISEDLRFLNCSWSSTRGAVTFTLFYKNHPKLTNICSKECLEIGSFSCTWDYTIDLKYEKVLTFLLQSCSYYGCSNQTFRFDHLSILKLAAPWGIRVSSMSSNGVLLRWGSNYVYITGKSFQSSQRDFLYKVEYWYSGIKPLEVNSSLVSCDNYECQIELKLPCPGQYYQVWIYVKLKRSAEDLWSEPTSISFFLDGENKLKDGCNWKPPVTKEVMTYFAQQLIYDVNQELIHLRKKVSSIQEKRDKIRAKVAKLKELKQIDRH